MLNPDGSSADALYDAICTAFEKDNIAFDNLLGYGSDNANSMAGCNHSLKTHLQTASPHMWPLGCTCHSAALCALHANSMLPEELEQLIKNINQHFCNSTKRRKKFKLVQDMLYADGVQVGLGHIAINIGRWLEAKLSLQYGCIYGTSLHKWVPSSCLQFCTYCLLCWHPGTYSIIFFHEGRLSAVVSCIYRLLRMT